MTNEKQIEDIIVILSRIDSIDESKVDKIEKKLSTSFETAVQEVYIELVKANRLHDAFKIHKATNIKPKLSKELIQKKYGFYINEIGKNADYYAMAVDSYSPRYIFSMN